MKKKNLAFTLAEVLIVIGIIGVVAALTLPNLNHATGDKEKVTKVKKIYSALTEAVDRAQVIYGTVDTWGNGLSTGKEKNERFAKRVTEFMKVSKDCGFNEGCFSNKPFLLANGSEKLENYLEDLQSFNYYMVVLTDGISLAFNYDAKGKIRIDVDGPNKGKNQYGNDIFDFTIFIDEVDVTEHNVILNQIYPSYSPDSFVYLPSDGNYSTVWVIENGNLDYLMADSTGKCNDSDVVLNWTTNTSCH